MKIAKRVLNEETKSATLAFTNNPHLTIALEDLPEHTVTRLALFGLATKWGNSYATNDGEDTAYAKALEMQKQLLGGVWNAGGKSKSGILAEALARATGRTLAEAVAVLAGKSDEEKRNLRKHKKMKAAIAEITAERAAADAEAAADDDADDIEDIL